MAPTTITTSTASTATAYSNQRKIDRCQNGVLWAHTIRSSNSQAYFSYSTDDGATWTDDAVTYLADAAGNSSSSTAYVPNSSIFIDLDDYCHWVYKHNSNGYIYYRRGTPNAGRTAWTWSAATTISTNTNDNYPDVVAHREGTGWRAHVTSSHYPGVSFSQAQYQAVAITSGGVISLSGSQVVLGFTNSAGAHPFPSIDFNHTGDAKTVAGSTPHLYVAWSNGTTGSGQGIRFKKATYSGGTWTWGTEREIDSGRYIATASSHWLNCLFDGTRVLIVGSPYDASSFTDVVLHERDAADTTTVTRTLLDNSTDLLGGSATFDGEGNVYLFGRDASGSAGSRVLGYRKWTRATATLDSKVTVDASGSDAPYVSAKRGYSNSRIEFIYTDGTASPYDVKYDGFSLNTAPNAPTSLSPSGANIDKDAAQRFTWTFSDPDTGDAQSAYDLRYRVQGTSTWTTVSGGATQYHDFPAGTFTAGTWEWQVRTTDNSGAVGPYSATATFTAAASPPAPSITAPVNNGTISTEQFTVEWTASSQDAYEVRRVADAAGSPDTGTVYATTGTVVSTARSQSMTFETNGRTEHVQVRVRSSGLWSSWASVKATVSYTVPAVPTLVALSDDTTASISLAITNPTPGAGEPTVTSNDVYVRLAAGQTAIDAGGRTVGGNGIRIAINVANGGAFTDRAAAAGVEYEYKVVAHGDNGTTSSSAWTPVS